MFKYLSMIFLFATWALVCSLASQIQIIKAEVEHHAHILDEINKKLDK
jgi:hypothetical protein